VVGPGPLALALGLEADPPALGGGAGYHYSQLAALIVETATGQTVAELLDARIVEPLGVEDTTIAPPGRRDPLRRPVIRPQLPALGDAGGPLTTQCVSCNLR
jgi:CubicO group peptidase (beta-lactamase class C family)